MDTGQPKRLRRLPDEGKVAGVCAGLAEYFDTDVTWVRLVWLILSVFPGTIIGGLIAYVAAWILMPAADVVEPHVYSRKRLVRSQTDRMIAGVCAGIADFFELDVTLVRLMAVILAIFPGAIVCGILVYALAWLVMPPGPVPTLAPSTSTP